MPVSCLAYSHPEDGDDVVLQNVKLSLNYSVTTQIMLLSVTVMRA
jgi:hypothetical protein